MKDSQIQKLIRREEKRQDSIINLIASENYASDAVSSAVGSVFQNKYAEGYPGARYYGGLEVVDELEMLTQERALKLFKLSQKKWSVNVQALSGSPANMAALWAVVPRGKKIMAMDLAHGGHLSHGYKVTASGKLWKQVPYGVSKETGRIDYEELMKIAKKEKPYLIIAGASAYSRKINFKEFRKIADQVGALLLVDMAHISGLVAAGVHPSPFRHADIVTTTTHKTLRGPRGALIFSKNDDRKFPVKINKAVFPGFQGGPHMDSVAGIATALFEASTDEFKEYSKQVVMNSKAVALAFKRLGWNVVSGGTDNHLVLVDVFSSVGIGGARAQEALEKNGIIVNMNMIPFDKRSPKDPSGIRIGTPAQTTRGWYEQRFIQTVANIDKILRSLTV